MIAPDYKPCDPRAMRLCPTLDARTHAEANTRRAGFDVLVTSQLGERIRDTWRGVVFRMSAKDVGLMVNFCPFCGTDLRPAHAGIDAGER